MVQIKPRANYSSPGDTLVLEDESGRVLLAAGALPAGGGAFPLAALARVLVTGVVVAVRGRVLPSGELCATDFAVPGLGGGAPPRALPPHPPRPPVYALLLSDLEAGVAAGAGEAARLPLALLAEWVAGLSGSGGGGGGGGGVAAARVARVIIAGGLVGVLPERRGGGAPAAAAAAAASGAVSSSFTDSRAVTAAEAEAVVQSLRAADVFLAQLAAAVEVDLMPGPGDPSNASLPQLPLHPSQLPLAARYSTLHFATNPHEAEVGGARFLGTSGQNVADIVRYAAASTLLAPGAEVAGAAGAAAAGAGGGGAAGAAGAAPAEMTAEELAAAAVSELAREGEGGGGDGGGEEGGEEGGGGGGGGGGSAILARATGGTSGDKALAMLAGTGAGAGAEARLAAETGGAAAAEAAVAASLNPLHVLTNTLFWRHIAPTAPDTLPCFPFSGGDPFVIEALPHLYFAGGAGGFGSAWLAAPGGGGGGTRVVAVPSFAKTGAGVLVDLTSATLRCTPICFAAGGAATALRTL
jgi:DNA polymerase II small subunit/DNA polymerase delta subunit B